MPYYVPKTDWNIQGAVKPEDYNKLESAAGAPDMHVMPPQWTSQTAANQYTITVPPHFTNAKGTRLTVKIHNTNSGPATIKMNGLTPVKLLKNGGAEFAAGQLKYGYIYNFVMDDAGFILLGEGGEYGTAVAHDVLAPKTIGTENGVVTGTMVNYAGTATPSAPFENIDTIVNGAPMGSITFRHAAATRGMVDSTSFTKINVDNFMSANIEHGVKVGNTAADAPSNTFITGSFTSDGSGDSTWLL